MLRSTTLNLKWAFSPAENLKAGHLRRALDQMVMWYEIRRQRHALLGLNDAMLKDIGISRADAVREGNKPFWRP